MSATDPVPCPVEAKEEVENLERRNAPRVAIVLVNWNGWRDTIECLGSLMAIDYRNFEVFVVDNGSTDGSKERIEEAFPEVVVAASGRNLGFAGGANYGFRLAAETPAKYYWLLNNDTQVAPQSLSRLVTVAEANSNYDFFGSWIVFDDDRKRLWFGGGSYDWRTGRIATNHYMESMINLPGSGYELTDWITGCSMLVRASVLHTVGFMDETYFLYREELEWQLRTNRKRPKALLLREPLVTHKVGRSTGSSNSYAGTIFMSRNYIKLARKYAGPALLLWIARWTAEFVIAPVIRLDLLRINAVLQSIYSLKTAGLELWNDCKERG